MNVRYAKGNWQMQRGVEEEGDSTNQMSIFPDWKGGGERWAWQVWFNEVQQRARASIKSIPKLTHWHVGLFTFWHFLCTIKHQRYVSQHWLIREATGLPRSISIQNISSRFACEFQCVCLCVLRCACVCVCLLRIPFDWPQERTRAKKLLLTDGRAGKAWPEDALLSCPAFFLSLLFQHVPLSLASVSASWQRQTSWVL